MLQTATSGRSGFMAGSQGMEMNVNITQLTSQQVSAVCGIARQAGQAILDIYHGTIDVTYKADHSPLTLADQASHQVITYALHQLTPNIPVISEESTADEQATRTILPVYWLIDPLDGTKEFIKRNGEFTVNIALIVDGMSVFGVVGVPVRDLWYWGGAGYGAFRQEKTEKPEVIRCQRHVAGDPWRVVGSRSHASNQEVTAYLAARGEYTLTSIGSSLKFCMIAEGNADLYPRMGPTCEWDTAAAQAVLEGAGGSVCDLQTGKTLRYSKNDILNPFFVASSEPVHA